MESTKNSKASNCSNKSKQVSRRYLVPLKSAISGTASLDMRESSSRNFTEVSVIAPHSTTTLNSTQSSTTSHCSSPKGPVVQPVIIGNFNGANLLTAVVTNKQEPSQAYVNSALMQNGQLLNFIPLVIPQLDNNRQITKKSVSTTLASSARHIDQDMHKHNTHELENKSVVEHSSVTNQDSELGCKIQLSSSDTIILNTSSVNASSILPCSSLSVIAHDDVMEKVQTRDKFPVSTVKKPFSLLTNISDRSVSLESIPSLGLFQPSHESTSNILYKSDSIEIISESKDAEVMVPATTYSRDSSEISIVGGNKIPHSVILLVKQHLNNIIPSSDKRICLITSPEQKECNDSGLCNTLNQAISDNNGNISISAKQQMDAEGEEHSDINTQIQRETIPLTKHVKDNLGRSGTVVLNDSNDNSFMCSVPQLLRSDTIILTCDNDQEVQSDDKLSEGFSFTSTNSSLPTSFEELLSEPSINKNLPVEIMNSSLIHQSSLPFPLLAFQDGHLNKSLYVLTNDGHLAAVSYISPDPLGAAQLSQLGLPNNVDTIPRVLPQSSFDASLRNVEEKETQTDLVFGTNTLHFKLADVTSDRSTYAVFMESLTTQTCSLPSTFNAGNNDGSCEQSQFSLQTLRGTVPAANIKTASQVPQSQSIKGDYIQQHILEPLLPCVLSEDDSTSFQCMECEEKFKIKHDLISHQRIHKNVFKCDLCNATFTRIGNFNRHRKIHNLQPESQNIFRCNDCGREFLQRCDLKRHLLIHSQQEPYRCEKCGKGYIRRSDLVVHMRFHNKEKTFLCSHCDKRFFQTGDLSRHIRNAHTLNSQLTCGHCNRKYARESTLIRHMKIAHKDIILSTVQQTLQKPEFIDVVIDPVS